jgi:oxygen-independent coproporphyrinogen-3 oxidase
MSLRQDYLTDELVETIYFGGGTPSLLPSKDHAAFIEKVYSTFRVSPNAEITLEMNPDDISEEKLEDWKETGINRLSIGIQSFFEEDLKWMNRAHTAEHATSSLQSAAKKFNNITVDLIYGTPLLTDEKWKKNIDKAVNEGVVHLSCYALTVEPKTPLHKLIKDRRTADIDTDKQLEQFLLLMEWMEKAGYEHYEISNFAKPGFRSRHNSSYWKGEKYLGIGPSAHSFDGSSRQWNISNNNIYIDSIKKEVIPYEKEILTATQLLNEYIMTSLRTWEGLDLNKVEEVVGEELRAVSRKFIERGLMIEESDHLKLTREGKLLADGIAAELFFEEPNMIVPK